MAKLDKELCEAIEAYDTLPPGTMTQDEVDRVVGRALDNGLRQEAIFATHLFYIERGERPNNATELDGVLWAQHELIKRGLDKYRLKMDDEPSDSAGLPHEDKGSE
jgi:hypothetical protein